MLSRSEWPRVKRTFLRYLISDSVKDKTFDSEYLLGDEIVPGQKPGCFPFPELEPLPTGPSEKFLEMMAAKLRGPEEEGAGGENGDDETPKEGEATADDSVAGGAGGDEGEEEPPEVDLDEEKEEAEKEVDDSPSGESKKVKPKLKVVSRHFCIKRIHCVDVDDCRCRHDKFFSVKRIYKRPNYRQRATNVGPVWRLVHPHLSRVHDVFEDRFWIWIVEEAIDGVDIITTLKEMESLSEFQVASLTRQLLLGLKAMHDSGVVHRNLTPNNVVFDTETEALKIVDVSLNRLIGEQTWSRMLKRFPGFYPPEMIEGSPTNDLAQDMWSAGILVYMMLTLGNHPFLEGEKVNYRAILKGTVDYDSIAASKSAKDFLSKLFIADPNTRYTVDQALKHPWVDLDRKGRSDIDIKVKEVEEEKEEEEEEDDNFCGCDISGQSSFEEFDSDEESCHCDEPPWDEIVRIGINGLNFSGVRLLKMALNIGNVAVTAVNDPNLGGDIDYLLYLLRSDSTRGPPPYVNVAYEDSNLVIPEGMGGGKQLKVFSIKSHESPVPWSRAGTEYVFDCTGNAKAHLDNYFQGGAKRVIVTGSDAADYPNIAVNYNIAKYNKKMKVVGAPPGIVHCTLPLLKILHETYGVHEALITELKSMGEQLLTVDGPSKGKSWRLGRGAGQNIIPVPSDAGRILGDIVSEFQGKIKSTTMFVPSHEVAVLDATFILSNGTNWDHLEETLDAAAAKPEMEGVFFNIKEELVSTDFRSETSDCNLDFNSSLSISESFLKLVAWFDDEGTKFRRALDLAVKMADVDKKNVKRAAKGPTPGQRLFDDLALTEATRRSHVMSLDAGQALAPFKHVSFSKQAVPTFPGVADEDRRRETSPGVLLTGEFGLKPVEEQPEGKEATPVLSSTEILGAGDPAPSNAAANTASTT